MVIAGLLTILISPLGRTLSPGHRLGSWTSMVLSVLNITGQPLCPFLQVNKQMITYITLLLSKIAEL